MALGFGAGAAQGLESVLADLYQKQLLRQREAQLAEQARQADMQTQTTLRGQDLVQGRFDTSRGDELAAAAQAAEEKARLERERGDFISTLPAWLQGSAQADTFGLNLKPEQFVEAPESREQASAREFGDFEKREGVKLKGQLRAIGATQAGQRELETLRQKGRQPLAGAGTQADAAQSFTTERNARARDLAQSLIERVTPTTAGPIGSALSFIGGSPSADLSADLETLASQIAFNELQEMRNASKTGGALGSVSERELGLLENSVASLRQSQSPGQLRSNLQKIVDTIDRWNQAKAAVGGAGAAGTAGTAGNNDPLGIRK